MADCYDMDGNPIDDVLAWGRLFSTTNRRVAETQIYDSCVSTVWLGLDHGIGAGPPLIFETMIFGGPLDDFQERYSTRAQAEHGHELVVKLLRAEYARRIRRHELRVRAPLAIAWVALLAWSLV